MSGLGVRNLQFINGKLNAEGHVNTLSSHLKQSAEELGLVVNVYFNRIITSNILQEKQ